MEVLKELEKARKQIELATEHYNSKDLLKSVASMEIAMDRLVATKYLTLSEIKDGSGEK